MSGRRLITYGGIAALGAGTYYLYSAGGDPKLAQKKLEHDASTASRQLKGEIPGREKEARKAGEEGYEAVRAKVQDYADQARAETKKAEQKFDAYSADAKRKFEVAKREAEREFNSAGKEVNAAVDKFDKKVTESAAKSQSWLGSWFGGK